ncbi:hypothetical protein ACIA49_00270 [Kribbella sp. NPDC051587]|uniref:hypothetical protein n=1 Tax=Kribbella sp. NPDC051587 TaxID=3364119 RepID=UPI0037BBF913
MNPNYLLLILIPIALLFVIGPMLVMRAQRRGAPGAQAGLQQAPGETREEFVRRNAGRAGVVADGATLVDLYDRIRVLEERLARAEEKSG